MDRNSGARPASSEIMSNVISTDFSELEKLVLERLKSLNAEIEGAQIAAFYLVEDDVDPSMLMADTIWVSNDTSSIDSMEFLNDCCKRAGDATKDLVSWVHCIYRTDVEFRRDYGSIAWQNRLQFVDEKYRQRSAA